MSQIRVFVVDDSVLFRRLLLTTINSIPGVRTVGVAGNGKEALEAIPDVKPDLITLDVAMPVMDGLDTLRRIRTHYPEFEVVMVSAFTSEGAQATLQALEAGALDVIAKPDTGSESGNATFLRDQFSKLLSRFAASRRLPATISENKKEGGYDVSSNVPMGAGSRLPSRPEVVAVGVSTGGPGALGRLLPCLPADFPLPVLIVQHMPPLFTGTLADSLQRRCMVRVVEASDGETVAPGTAYIAPGGRHMKVHRNQDGRILIRITDEPEENHCKPSVNYLFRSVSQVYEERCVGVIMTGMGSDGVLGLQLMKRRGAYIIAQDRETSTVWGMPRVALEAGVVDHILPLDAIGPELLACVKR